MAVCAHVDGACVSVNLDPQQPLATQFLITNRGKVPIYDVRFSCGIGRPGGTHMGDLSSSTLSPISQSAIRSCAVESQDIATQVITVSVTYRWPLIRYQSTSAAHFSLKHGTPGFFLVPEGPSVQAFRSGMFRVRWIRCGSIGSRIEGSSSHQVGRARLHQVPRVRFLAKPAAKQLILSCGDGPYPFASSEWWRCTGTAPGRVVRYLPAAQALFCPDV
jgi:hypothetical protein